jgi:hypothetical protein
MNSETQRSDITVWTIDGYEGRFVDWDGTCWRAYDYHNFRHVFSAPQGLGAQDLQALRREYSLTAEAIPSETLLVTPPRELRNLATSKSSTPMVSRTLD